MTARQMTLDETIDRLIRLAVRREMEGNYTDAMICRSAAGFLAKKRETDARRGRKKIASPEIVAEIRQKIEKRERMPNGLYWGVADLARLYRLGRQTIRNIVDRKGAYK